MTADAMSTNDTADEQVDLLVIGGGGGGMAAALAAAIEGQQVLLCEKSRYLGGSTARSSGGIWVPGNIHTAQAGKPDSISDAEIYLSEFFGPDNRNAARETYLRCGPKIVDWLHVNSQVRFESLPAVPDYRPYDGASTGGRALAPLAFDGRLLGKDLALIAPPLASSVVLGGMMLSRADLPHFLKPFRSVPSFLRVTCLVGRYLRDRLRYRRTTNLLAGNALVGRLLMSLKQRDVAISTETPAVDLIVELGRVVGAVLERDGRCVRIRAKAGVVLATGGFSHDAAWRERLMNPREAQTQSLTYEASQGNGLTMAAAAGAKVERGGLRSSSVWSPISIFRNKDGSEVKHPHFFAERPKPGFIAVSRAGGRFVNEAVSYHDFVAAMLESDDVMRNLPAYLICDSEALQRYGLGIIPPGRRNLRKYLDADYIVTADTIAALGAKLRISGEQLAATVERNNEMARLGVDADFGKGSSALDRFHGDGSRPGNPCLGPIATAPFVAVALWPADLATYAGVATDECGQALDSARRTIPGLHVCGNDMTSIFEGEAPAPGVTLGPALVFGVIAAQHALLAGEFYTPDGHDSSSLHPHPQGGS